MRAGRFLTRLVRELIDDGVTNVGAMMAFYAVLAIFPMLVFVLSISLLVVDHDTVREGLHLATRTMPESVRDMIEPRVEALLATSGAGFAVLGAGLALWGASRGAIALMKALNVVFDVRETRSWVIRQATALGVTLGVALLIVLALVMLVIGPSAGRLAGDRLGLDATFELVWGIARWLIPALLVMVVWAALYKFLPNTDAPFRVFTPGAIVGVLIWLGVSALFGAYLGRFNNYEAIYGALGGAIIFLTWLWLSNISILVGAAINDVLASMRRGAPDHAPSQLA